MLQYNIRKKFQNNLKRVNLLYGVDRVVQKINTVSGINDNT